MVRLLVLVLAAVVTLGAACGEGFILPPARFLNELDTITLFALDGSPLERPSAYNMFQGQTVRTDRSLDFDFAVNVRGDSALLLPTGALGLPDRSGWVRVGQAFDDVRLAPAVEYEALQPALLVPGDVLVLRSRFVSCFGTLLPVYAKIEVIDTSLTDRSMTLQLLLDRNCGYRGLEPGPPSQ